MILPDYPAWLVRGVEQGIDLGDVHREGLGGTCVFVNGALGSQIGPGRVEPTALDGTEVEADTFASAEATGTNVAEYVFRALDAGETEETADLSFVAAQFHVDVVNYRFQTAFLIGIFDREVYNYDPTENIDEDKPAAGALGAGRDPHRPRHRGDDPRGAVARARGGWLRRVVHAARVEHHRGRRGPAPSGARRDLEDAPCGPYLLEQMDGDYRLLFGLTQDFLGYIIPEFDFKVDSRQPYFEEAPGEHYEETNSLGPHAAQVFMGNLQTLLEVRR